MPTYTFQCPKCEKTETLIKTLTEPIPEIKCSNCKKLMNRIYGIQTIIFKGTGWGQNPK